ncbi:hypothetical protein K8R61_03245 [bacterium]|nr:hypothetical protein [bacterium]
MKKLGNLGIGPMSSEIIEAVFSFSEKENKSLMLIASKNQIDWDRGYVNNWNTEEYMEYIEEMKKKYLKSQVYICRDHCGPGFKNDNLDDVSNTIDSDIENNFDLIHIDFCLFKGSRKDILNKSKRAIEYIHKKNSNILIEIGTDENSGDFLDDTHRIEEEMKFFSGLKNIVFYVVQTGSLIKEVNQVGNFNKNFIKKIKELAIHYNLKLKEHNADYLDSNNIALRQNLIDAVNVAPQYGVLQTSLTIQKCLQYGINLDDFLEDSYKSKKWEKWLYKNNPDNKFLCSLIAGHYNFSKNSYKKIYEEINMHENFRETIIQAMMKNFKLYINNL